MNVITITGRITAEPELKVTTNGKNVLSFTVAVRRDKDTTDFLPCTAWNKTAEIISQYFHKGDQIGIIGSLQTRHYEKDGQKRTAYDILVDKFDFIGGKADKKESEQTNDEPNPYANEQKFEEIGSDEDLPF